MVCYAKVEWGVRKTVKVRIARRLSPEEVVRKISEYEKILNTSDLGDRRVETETKGTEVKGLLSEWRELMQAYQAYEEGGELDYVVEEDSTLDSHTIEKVFTEKRLKLIAIMGQAEFTSISHLASHLERDNKNDYEDLRILRKAGIVKLIKKRRNVQPKLLIDGISLVFR